MRTKRMKIKRLWSFLLAAVMSLALVSTSAIADEQAGGAGTDIVNDVDSSGNVGNTGTNNADDTGINNPDGTGTSNSDGTVDESPDVITSYMVNVTLPPSCEDEEEVFKCAENSGALEQAISEGGAIENIVLTYDMGEYPDASALSEMMMSWADAVNAALTDTGLTAAYNAEDNTIVISGIPTKDVNLNLEEVLGNYDAEPLVDSTHEHCICGNHKTSGCDDVKLTWIAVDNINDIKESGNYYLTKDQTLSSTWQCKYDVNLCLNGKSVVGASNVAVIEVVSGASLTITDCKTKGKITHDNTNGRGINNGGTFVLWNGSITGNTTDTQSGGGVRNEGDFTMRGGNISNNTVSGYDGGGVYNCENKTFTMYGGSITGNTAQYGGGVDNDGSMIISGGSITGNTATDKGGGVYEEGDSLTVSGVVRIKGNTKGGAANNVYLMSSLTDSRYINVSGSVSEGTRIGITSNKHDEDTAVVTGSTETKYFVSDDSAYATRVNAESTGLYLGEAASDEIQTHCICGGHGVTECDEVSHNWIYVESLDEVDDNGYYALKNDVTLTGTWTCDYDVYLCLNGNTITGASGSDAIIVSSNKSLTITDCKDSDAAGKITHTSGSGRGICNYGTVTLWNGSITGNSVNGVGNHGAGVYNSGMFIMNGGSVSNNSTDNYGGGVYNNGGTFTMNGGNISSNRSGWLGGGVCNGYGGTESTFILNDGSINNNNAVVYSGSISNGGGVYNGKNCTFTMNGGIITGNSGKNLAGGGVYNCGNFTITGGSITENTAVSSAIDGGGVYQSAGTLTMSGNPTITGNKAGNSVNNVRLYSKSIITVAEPGMSKDAKVGITGPTNSSAVVDGSTDDTVFFSDNSAYELVDNGENGLKFNQHKHCVCGKTDCSGDGHDKSAIWKGISNLSDITAAGNYYLKDDVTLSDTWTCDYDVKLCLNGHTITGASGNSTINVGRGKSLTITDCHTGDDVGKITHKSGETGRGVYNSGGTLVLWNGSICGNTVTNTFYAAGIFNDGGTVTMYGGSVSGNSGAWWGSGVWNCKGTFNLAGGTISGNSSQYSGGAICNSDGKVNITGGSITGNSAVGYQGGAIINKSGTITMSGGLIKDNTAKEKGGAIYLTEGMFEFTGGTISSNKAADGGAIYIGKSAAVTMSGDAAMSGNTATGSGGAVQNTGTVNVNGGTISGNTANWGGGINNDNMLAVTGGTITENSAAGGGAGVNNNKTFEISGSPVISDNDNGNVRLEDGKTITIVNGGLTDGADIGITAQTPANDPTVVSGTSVTTGFFSDDNSYVLTENDENNGLKLVKQSVHTHCVCGWPDCQKEGHDATTVWTSISSLNEIKGDGDYVLKNDVTVTETWRCSYNVRLCLNGNDIIYGGEAYSAAIKVDSNKSLDITDCSDTSEAGNITHAAGVKGIGVFNEGTFTLWNGNISGNTSNSDGGGVYNYSGAEFIMNDGSIKDNTAQEYGGGVYNLGTFTMTGGEIKDNKIVASFGYGAGVEIESNAVFNMTGGEISGNSGGKSGGGVGVYNGTFTMTGGNITGNSSGSGSGVYVFDKGTFKMSGTPVIEENTGDNVILPSGKTIEAGEDGMSDEAHVGITGTVNETVVSGTTSLDGFFSDNSSYVLTQNDENNGLKLVKPSVHTHCVCGKTDCRGDGHNPSAEWTPINGTISGELESGNYYLYGDVEVVSDTLEITGNVNICLNGHSLIGTDAGSPTITVNQNASLTITDCQSEAGSITHAKDANGEVISGSGIKNYGTLTIWNGSVTGNEVPYRGGGVYNTGNFIMNGGSITDNLSRLDGGGVYNKGTVTINGGSISENESYGAGGGLYNCKGETITITGGSITKNAARYYGGGLFNGMEGITTITGGSITDNDVVYNDFDDDVNSCGGGICNVGALKLSGNINITGNKVVDSVSNVSLMNLYEDGDTPEGYQAPTITAENIAGTSRVGISAYTPKDGLTVLSGSTDTTVFTSDDSAYYLVDNKNGGLMLSNEPDSGDDGDDSGDGGDSGKDDSDSGKGGSGGSDGSGSADSGNSGSGSANTGSNTGTAVSGGAANTGDESNMMLWIMLMILGGAGVVSSTIIAKKKNTADK